MAHLASARREYAEAKAKLDEAAHSPAPTTLEDTRRRERLLYDLRNAAKTRWDTVQTLQKGGQNVDERDAQAIRDEKQYYEWHRSKSENEARRDKIEARADAPPKSHHKIEHPFPIPKDYGYKPPTVNLQGGSKSSMFVGAMLGEQTRHHMIDALPANPIQRDTAYHYPSPTDPAFPGPNRAYARGVEPLYPEPKPLPMNGWAPFDLGLMLNPSDWLTATYGAAPPPPPPPPPPPLPPPPPGGFPPRRSNRPRYARDPGATYGGISRGYRLRGGRKYGVGLSLTPRHNETVEKDHPQDES